MPCGSFKNCYEPKWRDQTRCRVVPVVVVVVGRRRGLTRNHLRRGLFERTLQTHYSKFLPDHVAVPPMLNVQRSTPPFVKESWIDAKSGCVLFHEDGSAYWTITGVHRPILLKYTWRP